jgi:hypothetical protein
MADTTSPVQPPASDADRAAMQQQVSQGMQAATISLQNMAQQYRTMKAFRELGGLPPTDDAWTDSHESGTQTIYAAYALSNQYVSEAQAQQRQIGTVPNSTDIGITGVVGEVMVQGDQNGLELVQSMNAGDAAATAGEALVAQVQASGYVAAGPLLVVAAVVVTLAAVWAISEMSDLVKKKIEQVQQRDAEQLPIKLKAAGYTADQATALTQATLAQAQQIAAGGGQPSGTQNITETIKTVVWGGAALLALGGVLYIAAPFAREMLTAKRQRYATA